MSYIVYERPDGGVSVIIPAPGVSHEAAMQSVPEGARSAVVNVLPDRGNRDAWRLVDGQIVVDESQVPVPDPTPLQLLEEMESRTLGDGANMADRFVELLPPREQMKFQCAQYIRRDDPRIAQFGPAFEIDDAGIDDLFRAAAQRGARG